MGDSSVVGAYAVEEAPAPPGSGVAAASGLPPGAGVAARDASAASALVRRIAAEAAAPGPADAGAVAVIAGVPLGVPPAPRRPRVLLGISGSVASIKLAALSRQLLAFADVAVVATKSARHFFAEADLPAACLPVLTDEDEWREWRAVGDPVVHIELRRWADALVIAPLSANTLAKLANGLCDNLLTCVVRAWDHGKPLLAAPAMNTCMWESPFTGRHLEACREVGVQFVDPVAKRLACGDVGQGGMAAPEAVAAAARAALAAAGFDVEECGVE